MASISALNLLCHSDNFLLSLFSFAADSEKYQSNAQHGEGDVRKESKERELRERKGERERERERDVLAHTPQSRVYNDCITLLNM